MENHKDYSATIKSCAIAFLCVCEQIMDKKDLELWAKGECCPDDFMDSNQVLLDVIENYGISTELNMDGEMPSECDHIFWESWKMTTDLNQKKHTIVAVEKDYQYSLAELHSSILDIYSQWVNAKITTQEGKDLARNCCAKFLEDNK